MTLLEAGANSSTADMKLLMVVLKRGANPDMADKEGNTLMHTAESPELMAALLTRGGDPNLTNQVDQPHNRPVVHLIPRANLMR